MRTKTFLLAGLGLMLGAASVRAGEPATDSVETNMTVITSRHLDFDYPKRVAVLDGDVLVVDPRVTIKSDSMTILFATNNQPETITAVGNVKIDQESRMAVCTRATYSVKSGLLVLTGKPRVTRGTDVLSGSRIIFSRDDDKIQCEDAKLTVMPGTSGPGLDSLLKR